MTLTRAERIDGACDQCQRFLSPASKGIGAAQACGDVWCPVNELFRHFGYDMTLVADLNSNPPTLATWARERMDMQAAYVVVVTNHWVAVRGQWFCDSWTRGVPVKIKDAPHRRKRVRFVYVVTVVPQS